MSGYKYLFTLVSLLLVSGSHASADIDELMTNLDSLNSFSADFRQHLISAEPAAAEPSLGHMAFKRPGKFRWIYETPYEQEIVSDGRTLWVFDRDLEQVTIRPADDRLARSPLTILDNPDSILELYAVELLPGATGEQKIKLIPKDNNAGFKYTVLTFSGKKPVAIEFYDNFDQHNSLSFHNIEMNSNLDEAQFNFVPPVGVDVINTTEQP